MPLVDISTDELYHILALIILMGHYIWDIITDCWSTNSYPVLQCHEMLTVYACNESASLQK